MKHNYSILYSYEDTRGFHRILSGIKAESKETAKEEFISMIKREYPERDIVKVEVL